MGFIEGLAVGLRVGGGNGAEVGFVVGLELGFIEVGFAVRSRLGARDGGEVGLEMGFFVGLELRLIAGFKMAVGIGAELGLLVRTDVCILFGRGGKLSVFVGIGVVLLLGISNTNGRERKLFSLEALT